MENEVLYENYAHGMAFNTSILNFNSTICDKIIKEELNDINKEILFRVLYVSIINKNNLLTTKSRYGKVYYCLGDSVNEINNYTANIIDKIKDSLSMKEIDTYMTKLENYFEMNEKEKTNCREVATPVLEQNLGFSNNKLEKYFKLINNIRTTNPNSTTLKKNSL